MEVNWEQMAIRLVLSVLIGGAVGIEREFKNRPAGMRTHVLVCLGACLIAILDCLMVSKMLLYAIKRRIDHLRAH